MGDIAEAGLDSASEPMLFAPFRQDAGRFITYMVRTAGDPDRVIGAASAALRNGDPQLSNLHTVEPFEISLFRMLVRPVPVDRPVVIRFVVSRERLGMLISQTPKDAD